MKDTQALITLTEQVQIVIFIASYHRQVSEDNKMKKQQIVSTKAGKKALANKTGDNFMIFFNMRGKLSVI